MFSRFLLFFAPGRRGGGFARRRPAGGDLVRRPAGADLVHESTQNPVSSSTGTTSLRSKAPPASRTWCFTPRKSLLFRRRAPRLWGQRRRRRTGRGASLPAKPCSFVDGHHVFGAKGAAGEPDVVLHSPQNLALSSTGTMSLGPKALGRRGLGARFLAKPCSFVSLAPSPGAFSATGRRGFGARFPAKPCSFVNGHHVFGTKGAAGIRFHHYKS